MRLAAIATCFVVLLSLIAVTFPAGAQEAKPSSDGNVTSVATGLTNPRGFTWGDDGTLYLALAGTGGDTPATIDGAEIGVYGGPSASVVTIENGCAVPLVEGIPSGDWRDAGWIWGAHDVAFLDGELYILSAGGGIDFGNPDQPTGVLRLEADGTTTLVADISTWSQDNLPAFVPPDYNPSGSLYDMEVGTDRLWVSEAVGGRIITVTPDGTVTLVADISEGHPVPTGMAIAPDGGVYVGFLTAIPYPDGGSKVVHISPDGTVTDHWTGLTAITDIAIGPDGALYAAEMATGNLEEPPFIQPGTGRVVRMTGPDSFEPVVTELDFPAFLDFGSDGSLYITTPSFGPDQGVSQGMLLRIELAAGMPISLAANAALRPTCATATPGT
jgi:hypothetical protein